MRLDASIVGAADETVTVEVDPVRLQTFAEAIGERRDLYLDSTAARAAGYRDIPVPPTYHFSLGRERSRSLGLLEDRGVDLLKLLHGEQRFQFATMAHAGDRLTVARRVSDYFERKGGALKFIVIETDIRKPSGEPVSLGHETLVLPDEAPASDGRRAGSTPTLDVTGRPLASLRPGTVTRDMLARFGPASGDFNRVHLDPEAARSAGYGDVFAHGMLSMAWLGRLLTDNFPQEQLRQFAVRFHALTSVGAMPTCDGAMEEGDQAVLRVVLDDGTATLTGSATLTRHAG